MSLVLRLPRKVHLCRSSSNVPRLPSFLEMLQNPHVLLMFDKVHNPVRLSRETTSERPKVVRACGVFHILTSKCASRHNGMHFFKISTSNSAPDLVCFVHFWVRNVLRATTACTFSTSQLPKVVRTRQFFSLLTSKCASRHNCVQFFISHLPSGLRTRRFSKPTFRSSGATNDWKNTATFSGTWIFFLLRLSLFDLLSSSLLFSSLLFFDSYHLCFSSVHIVGSLTSKLPSIIIFNYIHLYLPPMGWVPQKYPSISYLYIPYPLPIIILYIYTTYI